MKHSLLPCTWSQAITRGPQLHYPGWFIAHLPGRPGSANRGLLRTLLTNWRLGIEEQPASAMFFGDLQVSGPRAGIDKLEALQLDLKLFVQASNF